MPKKVKKTQIILDESEEEYILDFGDDDVNRGNRELCMTMG